MPDAIKVFDEVLKPMGKRPKGVRIDSGDIAYLSKKARQMLDAAGYPDCSVCASNSLDEYIVRDLILQGARVDSFGIGENMITAKSDPVFGGVYKLAAVKDEDVTGKKCDVFSMGGGTYARQMGGAGVAFGASFDEEESNAHQANECINVEQFKLHAQICLEAMYRMFTAD